MKLAVSVTIVPFAFAFALVAAFAAEGVDAYVLGGSVSL